MYDYLNFTIYNTEQDKNNARNKYNQEISNKTKVKGADVKYELDSTGTHRNWLSSHFWGKLKPALDHVLNTTLKGTDAQWEKNGVFKAFNQKEAAGNPANWANHDLSDTGYVYYPTKCTGGALQCKIVTVMHGKNQMVQPNSQSTGLDFIKHTGWCQHAATNDLIMLFPQVNPKSSTGAFDISSAESATTAAP